MYVLWVKKRVLLIVILTELYTAVDKTGEKTDFMLSKKCDKKYAKKFFSKSIGYSGRPQKMTIDKIGSNTTELQ